MVESLPQGAKEDHLQSSVIDNVACEQSLEHFPPPVSSCIVSSMRCELLGSPEVVMMFWRNLLQSFIPFNKPETTLLPLWPTAY